MTNCKRAKPWLLRCDRPPAPPDPVPAPSDAAARRAIAADELLKLYGRSETGHLETQYGGATAASGCPGSLTRLNMMLILLFWASQDPTVGLTAESVIFDAGCSWGRCGSRCSFPFLSVSLVLHGWPTGADQHLPPLTAI